MAVMVGTVMQYMHLVVGTASLEIKQQLKFCTQSAADCMKGIVS